MPKIDPLLWFYFARPLQRLADNWPIKSVIVVIATAFWSAIDMMFGVYSNLLSLSPYLLALASIAFFGDFASAILATLRDQGWAKLDLIRFRQLLIKAAYWIIVIFVFSSVATAAKRADVAFITPVFSQVDVAAVFWLTLQDTWSIVQNWRGQQGAKEWFHGMMSLVDGDLSIDDLANGDENG